MSIVSKFIREQERYSKNQLRDMLEYDDHGVEKFIKNLKSFGILKTVKNKPEQKEMSELLDDDIEITDEHADNSEVLYVFDYVGIVTVINRVLKIYPKYILTDKEPLNKMKQVLKVIEKYQKHENQTINLFNGSSENRSFNILSIILYFLEDYYSYGLYTNSDEVLELNGEGDVLWDRTIDECLAIINEGRPYYVDLVTRYSTEDDMDFFKRLHACILTDCSEQLNGTGISELFELELVYLTDEKIDDLGDKEYILNRISNELNIQYNTRKQILLKTMYAYVSQIKKVSEEDFGISMIGTGAFHVVWEKVCADVFDSKLETEIGKIKMHSELASGYNKKTKLIDLIEKPKWENKDVSKEANETLKPDLINISDIDGVDCFIILDAKYYLLQLERELPLRGNPGVGDLVKQYMYQLAYDKFIKDHNIGIVRNFFLMPTDSDEIISKGNARIDMLSNLITQSERKLENIKIRLLPAEKVYRCYLNGLKINPEKLMLNKE